MAYTGTKAQSGNQTTVSINTGTVSSPTWTLVGEISDFTQSGTSNKSDDATNLQSTAEEFIPTILTPGKFAGTMARISGDAGQVAVKASANAVPPTLVQYQIQLPKTSTQTSAGDKLVILAMVEEFNNIGNISFLQGRFDDARQAYEAALKSNPGDAGIMVNLARVLLQSGKKEPAKKLFRDAAEIDPRVVRQYPDLAASLGIK